MARGARRLYDERATQRGGTKTTKTNGKLLVAAILVIVGCVLAPAGCGGLGRGGALTLASMGWDENVAVSNLTKVLLVDELGYRRVDIDTQDGLGSTYRGVASGELDAFQDVWLPNQEAHLKRVAGDVERLDPWYLGETKQGMAVPAYMDVRSIDQLNSTDARLIYGIEGSSVVMHKVGRQVIPAYGLEQQLAQGPTAGMLEQVEQLYVTREDFVFLAWSPHWMNWRYDIRYLDDPKDAMGPTNDPAELSTIVRVGLREEDPVAYDLMDTMELTEKQIRGLESAINKHENPLVGTRRWASENREVVRSWISAANDATG